MNYVDALSLVFQPHTIITILGAALFGCSSARCPG
jgi:hypothetical protein